MMQAIVFECAMTNVMYNGINDCLFFVVILVIVVTMILDITCLIFRLSSNAVVLVLEI